MISAVTINLTGAATASTSTDSSGNYSFTDQENGNYTITPSLTGYTFLPSSTDVTVSGENKQNVNFTATANTTPTYSISGTVSGAVLSGVTINLTGATNASAKTDTSGHYSFSNVANGDYTMTASKNSYTFSPASISVTVNNSNVTEQNFTATATTVTVSPVTISTTTVPSGVQGESYTATLTATGGTTSYMWAIASGTLPSGLAINSNTGVISGTPSAGGVSTFTVEVTDSSTPAKTAMQSLSITIVIPLTNRIQAVQETVSSNSNCTSIGDFYWEIGDASGSLISGAVGTTYSSSTAMDIASASKLIFGAYVVESFKTDLSKANSQAMRMGSGYVSLNYTSCVGKKTVDDCFQATHLLKSNSDYTDADKGKFYYNGGHFQWYADVVLKLGSLDNAGLAAEMKNQMGQELNIAYTSPQLAAGAYMSAADYAQFLRKIISGGLAIKYHLGEDPVCTLPGTCPTAVYSPASPYNWHYSWGHWVEDDSSIGDDGAFSSPGAFGFYPWIDSQKQYYGILARKVGSIDISNGVVVQAYKQSVMCGRLIRAAFLTGVAQ